MEFSGRRGRGDQTRLVCLGKWRNIGRIFGEETFSTFGISS